MRGRIFISYRRDDAAGDARGVADRLARDFGKSNVFMDVDNLLAGQRFDRELDRALSQCDVLIAILGPRWMELLSHAGGERDFVRDEIAAALKRDIVVIPVLVGREGHMPALPQAKDLPEELRELVLYQKHSVAHETFGRDTAELIAAIAAVLSGRRPPRPMKPLLIGAGAGLMAALIFLIYQFDLVSWTQPRPRGADPRVATALSDFEAGNRAEADSARRKSESNSKQTADAEATQRSAEAEAKRRAEEEARKKAAAEEQAKREAAAQEAQRKADAEAKKAEEDEAKRSAEEAKRVAGEDARSKAADEEARKKAVEEQERKKEDGAGKRAEDEARKKSGQEAESKRKADEIAAACDRLAASPDDSSRPAGIPGVEYARIDSEAAWNSCSAAMNLFPDVARFILQAGRAAASRRDDDRAMVLYRKAAELGNAAAMNNVGGFYQRGLTVAQDYTEARKWYEKAAALGSGLAMANLGHLYHEGRGVRQDHKEARKWYEKGTTLGNSFAMNNLGVLYDSGAGITQNSAEARKWFERAADLGNALAMRNIGNLYEKGRGVAKNREQARKWYQKAADAGDEEAKRRLAAFK